MHWLFVMCLGVFLNLAFFVMPSHSEMFIYPKDRQSAEQQELDEFACYKWAKQRTGVDPNQPAPSSNYSPRRRRGGGILGSAMGGAAVGGASGMLRQRRARVESHHRQQQATATQQQNRQGFNRAYGVCLEARGYKVG